MDLFRWLACAAWILTATVACSNAPPKIDEAVKDDFERYVAQLSLIDDIEIAADAANQKALTDPKANDATYARALKDSIIPKYEAFERELARMNPTTNEVLGLHKLLLNRTEVLLAAFKELLRAGETGDKEAIARANAHFAESKYDYKKWSDEMLEMNRRFSKNK